MSQRTDAVVISTIGIDTGKNTLHLVGLDDQGTIVLREKVAEPCVSRHAPWSQSCSRKHSSLSCSSSSFSPSMILIPTHHPLGLISFSFRGAGNCNRP
jgi:hypothetical protein